MHRSKLFVVAAAIGAGCAGPASGVATHLGTPGPTQSEAWTSEVGGLRVLWNGRRGGPIDDAGAWLATDPEELATAWRNAQVLAPVPRVDFTRDVVFAFAASGGVCPAEIVRAVSDGRMVRLLGLPMPLPCEDVRVGVAQVVAIPRRIVPPEVVIEPCDRAEGYAFHVRPPSPKASAPVPALLAESATAGTPMPSQGLVDVPVAGHIALRTLADGTQVWVAHRVDHSISVLAASVVGETGLSGAVAWWKEENRLGNAYDSHGRNMQGDAPLPAYAFRRLEGSLIEVLPQRAQDDDGPIESRDAAPALEGPDRPYGALAVVPRWSDIPDGQVRLLDASVVFTRSGPPRLCKVPARSLDVPFNGCAPEFPSVIGSFQIAARVEYIGPVVVRRRGDVTDLAIVRGDMGGYQ